MDYKDVHDYIVSRVGQNDIERRTGTRVDSDEFINLKENAISIYSVILKKYMIRFYKGNLTPSRNYRSPAGRNWSRIHHWWTDHEPRYHRDDPRLLVAPHQSLSALPIFAMELEVAVDNLEKATRLSAAHIARARSATTCHEHKKGTTICIGHGRSPLWRELKDFLVERLHVEVHEFNSIATAGIATTERLGEMLDAADFAFLIWPAKMNRRTESSMPA